MRNHVLTAAIAVFAAGCGQKEESALADMPSMPAASSTVAAPAPASTSAFTGGSSASAARKSRDPKQAFNAGVNMMMARDVCKLPAGDVAKFAAYSKWVVEDDQEMKKAYVLGAQKTAELYKAAAEKQELAELERQLCPSVKTMLTAISRGIRTVHPPVGQAPITQ
jgi:hypothetical protein